MRLEDWHDFFLLTGGAAATLLGLVFVAIAIAATVPRDKLGSQETRQLWVLPLVYAFTRVILVAALGVVPGVTWALFGGVIGALGLYDVARMPYVVRGLVDHHRTRERLDARDWRWYAVYPSAAAALMLGCGGAVALGFTAALYGIALGTVAYLVVGIHNAWELADFLAALR